MGQFTAIKWLNELAEIFKCQTIHVKDTNSDSNNICDLKSRKIKQDDLFEKHLQMALERIHTYAEKYLL